MYSTFVLYILIQPILFGIITVLGLVGNGLVIYVITTRDGMRTKTNVMLFNLALADVMFLLSCPPYTAYRAAHATLHLGSSAFDQVLCKSVTCILYVTAYVTIYTLVLIAVVRYVGIVCSEVSRFITRKTVVLSSCGLWIAMLAANSPIIFAYRMITFNTTEWCQTDSRRIVDTTFFTFAYFCRSQLSSYAVLVFGDTCGET